MRVGSEERYGREENAMHKSSRSSRQSQRVNESLAEIPVVEGRREEGVGRRSELGLSRSENQAQSR